MIVQRKGIEKRNPNLKNLISIENHFTKTDHKDRINGVRWEFLEKKYVKNEKKFLKKPLSRKTIPKIISVGVHSGYNRRQNSTTLKNFLQKNMFKKNCLKDRIKWFTGKLKKNQT